MPRKYVEDITMDKFFYRLTLQSIIKAILTAAISFFCTALIYTLFTIILQPISATIDYWFQAIVAFVITAITCFMLIFVKDDYSHSDTYSYNVGSFWSNHTRSGRKVRWGSVELMMLPLLAIALGLAYLFYTDHPTVMAQYVSFYSAAERITDSQAQDFFYDNMMHWAKLILAVFFFAQWNHVRNFAKEGRCPKCKAAFSLGFHQDGGTETRYASNITKKGRSVVTGSIYEVTTEDDVEVSRSRVGNTYGTAYDYYKTDTKTTCRSSICHCAFCNHMTTKYDVSSTSTTTKL